MKKLISVLLSVIVISCCFSVFSYAASNKTDSLISNLKNSDELSVTLTSGATLLGSSTDSFYVKGNDILYEFNNGFLTARVLLTDGEAYAYLPLLPFIYVKLDSTGLKITNADKLIENSLGVTFGIIHFVKSYNGTINGNDYYVEEYYDNAQTIIKFCYVGDDLKMISVVNKSTGSVQNTIFENISFKVEDALFAKPVGFDLSVLFKSFIQMWINSQTAV